MRRKVLGVPGVPGSCVTNTLVPGENDKPTVLALREIAGGLINHEMLDAQDAASEDERLEIPFTFSHEGSSDL